MKNYFDFTLTGKKFLPLWLVFWFLVVLPYGFSVKMLTDVDKGGSSSHLYSFLLVGVMIVALFISFFIIKITIEGVNYSSRQVRFECKFGTYLGKSALGVFLSIITLTIYMAWFIKDITRFFINKSSLNDSNFEFHGKGGKLFLLLLVSLYLPIILLSVVIRILSININQNFIHSYIYQVVTMIILIPYLYLLYKWMVNISFKEYQLKWQTEIGPSCVKIGIEMLLIIVTLGIYMPLGYLKLYKYFAEKTIAESEDKTLRFGFELDAKGDFLFIWGQLLLTLVTVGIYYPWAYSKIGKRILGKTYIENI